MQRCFRLVCVCVCVTVCVCDCVCVCVVPLPQTMYMYVTTIPISRLFVECQTKYVNIPTIPIHPPTEISPTKGEKSEYYIFHTKHELH